MIKIGISKGRIEKEFYNYLVLKKIIESDIEKTRKLITKVNDYELCSLKSNDIINLLSCGCIDIGILGSDVIEEVNNSEIVELLNLNTGNCYFALAALQDKKLEDIKVIATKYPNIANKLLKQVNIKCSFLKMNGSLEIAPNLGYADAIIDLVETGETLRANGLEEIIRFNNISTRAVTVKNNDNEEIKKLVKKLI